MEEANEVKITDYDRLMRAWENSMELARDFEVYPRGWMMKNSGKCLKNLLKKKGCMRQNSANFF